MDSAYSLSFQGSLIWLYAVLTLVALGISWWSYRRVVPQVSGAKRTILLSLRAIGIFLIGLLLLEPLLSHFSERTIGDRLGVAVDLSSSMRLTDKGTARYDKADSLIEADIPDNFRIDYYGFADTISRIRSVPDSADFSGQATNIANAVTVPLLQDGEDLGALLIVTDGANNVGLDPLEAAATINIPVYSLVVGGGIGAKDVFISKIDNPAIGYTNTEFAVDVEYGNYGYRGQSANVELRDGQRVLASRRVVLPADGALAQMEFKLAIAEEGAKTLSADITRLDGETYAANNARSFTIKLLKDKIKILMLASSLNWEFSYLKQALAEDSHFDVQTAIAGRQGGFRQTDMPPNLEAWGKIDLIVALDAGSRNVGSQLSNIEAAVGAGTGFLYIAGARSRIARFGDWDKLLPVKSNSRTGVVDGEFFPTPSAQPIARAIVEIDGLDWAKQPPLKSALAGFDIDAGAVVLLQFFDERGNQVPALVAGKSGRIKSAAITGFPWWPRYFRSATANPERKLIEKFWANLVRWLVTREDMEQFNFASDKPIYKLGEPVSFSATLFDANYNLLDGAGVDISINDSTGAEREFQLTGIRDGKYAGVFGSPSAGKYEYRAIADYQGDTIGTASGSFVVEPFSLEMENPSANHALMEQIASLTGGKSYTSADFANFAGDLKLKTKSSEVFSEFRLTGNTLVLIIMMLAFGLEWAIRKFSQLA